MIDESQIAASKVMAGSVATASAGLAAAFANDMNDILTLIIVLSSAGCMGGFGAMLLSDQIITVRNMLGRLFSSSALGTGAGAITLVLHTPDPIAVIAIGALAALFGSKKVEQWIGKILTCVIPEKKQ